MARGTVYSARSVFDGLKRTLHQYIEAQYHIWDEGLIGGRRRLLEKSGNSFQEPRLEATPTYVAGSAYEGLAIPAPARAILTLAARQAGTGIYPTPYSHQAAALEALLGRDEEVVVATGTGSGKTESFLMPILGQLAIESAERSESWKEPGVRALLLYPMNALVNDQVSRLRRLLGNSAVAAGLKGGRGRRATFGMYTSRTPYPGNSTPSNDRERIGKLITHLYKVLPEFRALLQTEGKWPAKDLERFVNSSFVTDPEDSELFSRQEMQRLAPDLLVTNYSMLEYMLLRPIERSIFEQTAEWLARGTQNKFVVVLDEAHMYRGSGGAEVAYLLRRLHARLQVGRERVRYILTSASLGAGQQAQRSMQRFAADLTGSGPAAKAFTVLSGEPIKKGGERVGTAHEAEALAAFDFTALHKVFQDHRPAFDALRALAARTHLDVPELCANDQALRGHVWDWLSAFGPGALAANLITARPQSLDALGVRIFPGSKVAAGAVESLLALMTFARESGTDRVFAPVRAHLFFRGLPGLFVCVNRLCPYRAQQEGPSLLGQVLSSPNLRCECGARVFELLTHRDCGAAFIRGYLASKDGDFLWHERSSGLWSDLSLVEAHFLVEVDRRSRQPEGKIEGSSTWLHTSTGRLHPQPPPGGKAAEYLELLRPDGLVADGRKQVLSFDKECPVCVRTWQGASKIMDLATKGEAPFAHLVREQVALQPITRTPTQHAPNGGRKTLLFSDGRQRAARLARDIPREVEQDVFRQVLLLGVRALEAAGLEPTMSRSYVSVVHVLSELGLQLFDGTDLHTMQTDITKYRKWFPDDLPEAAADPTFQAPPRFSALLLRQLGSRFYSVNALTLAYVHPARKALLAAREACVGVDPDFIRSLAVVWMQGCADAFAFDRSIKRGVRIQAAGYPAQDGIELRAGFTKRQRAFLQGRLKDLDALTNAFGQAFCEPDVKGGWFLAPSRVKLELALQTKWFQCTACTAVSPVALQEHCPNCLSGGVTAVDPEQTSYLRARKGFWRDPVRRVLDGVDQPLNLSVEEHTAQLSHRDSDESGTTTEEFERRFRDILVGAGETAVDVLSSTTTMEVGIDIGSLVAVGLRNVPPLRQNYQQRAGRAGRRGASISTVLTYAQNSPHDNHYFRNPDTIVSGEPTPPFVDTKNDKIIERHVHAQLIQAFFHARVTNTANQNLFTLLGATWEFFSLAGPLDIGAFRGWLSTPGESAPTFDSIRSWLPVTFRRRPEDVGQEFHLALESMRPARAEDIDPADENLIDFLFNKSFLPAYAFPRDLCALQIEQPRVGRSGQVQVVQRPQQGLGVALSEYAPGRLVVVNKKTYRVGSVTADGAASIVNRAERLFAERRAYVYCNVCSFTSGFHGAAEDEGDCPLCDSGRLRIVTVIRPEVVYPEGAAEVDEYDEEQVFSQATSAQLPLPKDGPAFGWSSFLKMGLFATGRNQPLVMVNKGSESAAGDGFLVCSLCGKASLDRERQPHRRDYLIPYRHGVPTPSATCNGLMEEVYLGYSFASDILLLRIPMSKPFRCQPTFRRARLPLVDALQSLCEAFVLAVSRELGIDHRELSAGHRFVRLGSDYFADIFLYDTLAGGAGYATEAGAVLAAVFDRVESLLKECECSSSCDKCLRHYGNRMHHEELDRFLALDLVRFIRTGEAPPALALSSQRSVLKPLADLLELAGWVVALQGAVPLTATLGARRIEICSFPSLVDPDSMGFRSSKTSFAFSPYEIAKDLPGAYGEVC